MIKSNVIHVEMTANNMRKQREHNGLSKLDLSVALKGVPITLIDDIENGRFIPTLEYMYDFCKYFSLSLDMVIVSVL